MSFRRGAVFCNFEGAQFNCHFEGAQFNCHFEGVQLNCHFEGVQLNCHFEGAQFFVISRERSLIVISRERNREILSPFLQEITEATENTPFSKHRSYQAIVSVGWVLTHHSFQITDKSCHKILKIQRHGGSRPTLHDAITNNSRALQNPTS